MISKEILLQFIQSYQYKDKEQIFICLNCLNSWNNKGFKKKDKVYICINCNEVVLNCKEENDTNRDNL